MRYESPSIPSETVAQTCSMSPRADRSTWGGIAVADCRGFAEISVERGVAVPGTESRYGAVADGHRRCEHASAGLYGEGFDAGRCAELVADSGKVRPPGRYGRRRRTKRSRRIAQRGGSLDVGGWSVVVGERNAGERLPVLVFGAADVDLVPPLIGWITGRGESGTGVSWPVSMTERVHGSQAVVAGLGEWHEEKSVDLELISKRRKDISGISVHHEIGDPATLDDGHAVINLLDGATDRPAH